MNAQDTGSDERRHDFFIIDNEAIDSYNLSPFTGWLYIVIVRLINHKTGETFPSVPLLAKKAGMSQRQALRCIKELETAKLIHVTRSQRPNSKEKAVNHYSLLPVTKREVVTVSHDVVTDSHNINTESINTKDSPVAKEQPQAAPRKSRQPDPWIDVISEHIFSAKPGTPKVSAVAGRAAQIKKWCLGQDVKIGSRTIDGCDLPVTPADVVAWATEWHTGKRIDVPQGLESFVQHFYEWRQIVESNRINDARRAGSVLENTGLLDALRANEAAQVTHG